MWYRRLIPRLRPDAWIALSIPIGCGIVLTEAYFRSDLHDADSAEHCAYSPTTVLIGQHHVRELRANGIVVIPNALSETQLNNARMDIRSYTTKTDGVMESSTNDDDVRQDVVTWIGEHDLQANKDDPIQDRSYLLHCIRLLRGVSHALDQRGYQVNDPPQENKTFLVPQSCQLALYKGNGNAGYARHLDQCHQSVYELGLLEWLRLSDYRSRSITAILYLNASDRPVSAGGALRCWVERKDSAETDDVDEKFHTPFDVLPKGGTLVIFQSDRVEHRVLPSSTDRYALTNWISEAT